MKASQLSFYNKIVEIEKFLMNIFGSYGFHKHISASVLIAIFKGFYAGLMLVQKARSNWKQFSYNSFVA